MISYRAEIKEAIILNEIYRDETARRSLIIAKTNPEQADEFGLEALKAHQKICELENLLAKALFIEQSR